jgi:hypothetical protein
MIYVTGTNSTSVCLSGNTSVTLTPPTSGTYQGVVLFQDRASSSSIAISGNAVLNTTATEYAPGAKVTLSGNEDDDNPVHTSLGSQWIVADLTLSGNAHFSITADANNRNEDPNAFLAAGGPVTPVAPVATLTLGEAQADLHEALKLWAAGLDSGTLQVLSRTTITIISLPAPYLGLAAPGAIYLDPTAEGYGWFTGSSSTTTPPAGKIDLLTVVAHELGHLFGLMDGNGTTLMAPTLAPGVRILPDAGDLLVAHSTLTTLAASPLTAGVTGFRIATASVARSSSGSGQQMFADKIALLLDAVLVHTVPDPAAAPAGATRVATAPGSVVFADPLLGRLASGGFVAQPASSATTHEDPSTAAVDALFAEDLEWLGKRRQR